MAGPHDADWRGGVSSLLGGARFQTYLAATTEPDEAIRLYSWNIEVSASLWGGFHLAEVCLRNAVNDRLADHFGSQAWWDITHLTDSDLAIVRSARRHLSLSRSGQFTPGHVVAELGFGFWIGLLGNRYHARLWEAATLDSAFPHYTGRRRDLHTALERLRKLRNRVAHHEPIFNRDLAYDHALLLSILGYLSSDVAHWYRTHSRFGSIILRRDAVVAGLNAPTF
ncbi:Abi family protein [Leifsonia shinshuensis]|uniref:Abi family protein n=1 Tax=Leifsonia shinshuensis TaxID=150026 RepID=A0A7G6YEU2_9MICO|nr:Abi family protein [Leifsonia shinshuensis]QNE37007.1 Abi family protein [Leifsonia shinshuensis]